MLYIVMPSPDLAHAQATMDGALYLSGADCQAHIEHDPHRTGYTATVNRGIRTVMERGDCDAVCVLGDDARPSTNGWLAELRDAMQLSSNTGFAGPSGPCRTAPQNTGKMHDAPGVFPVSHVAGFCVLVRGDVLRMGLMDEAFAHYGSDVDWQWAAKRDGGWNSVWVRHVYCQHEVHAMRQPWGAKDGALMRKKWGVA